MVSIKRNSMGDSECYYGESVWEEVEVTCDECGDELLNNDDLLYEYEGKWICENCLKGMFKAKNYEDFLREEEEKDLLNRP